MDKIQAHEAQLRAVQQIRGICDEYGMNGGIFRYNPCYLPESNRNRVYMVAGTDPALRAESLPQGLSPDAIIRRGERNKQLFYPHVWAFDLSANSNQMKATESLVEYLKRAEFLHKLYARYGQTPPEKIRLSEVHQLIDFYDMSVNVNVDARTREYHKKQLDWFFRREQSTGFRRKWLDYFRSEHFPDEKGPLAKILGYFRQHKQRTDLRQLMEVNADVHKLTMQEHEYKLFTRFLQNAYPDVRYAVGEKEVVNHGGVNNPKGTEKALGRRVTGEEYAVICKERFATEGWEALQELKPAYWEFRDVYYKACDEPMVAAAYNSVTLQFARPNALADLPEPLRLVDIPVTDFMNFVSLAKAKGFLFHIDNVGEYAVPSLETVHVVYSTHQQDMLRDIMDRMMDDKVSYSHVLEPDPEHPRLAQVLEDMDKLRIEQSPEHIIRKNHGR